MSSSFVAYMGAGELATPSRMPPMALAIQGSQSSPWMQQQQQQQVQQQHHHQQQQQQQQHLFHDPSFLWQPRAVTATYLEAGPSTTSQARGIGMGMEVLPLTGRSQPSPAAQLPFQMQQQQVHLQREQLLRPMLLQQHQLHQEQPAMITMHHQLQPGAAAIHEQPGMQQLGAAGAAAAAAAAATTTCKECGNQAKKDCDFGRCRTCCKSRGFECSTHVKSTWVPAAKRRERQVADAAAAASGQPRPKSKRNRAMALQAAMSAAATVDISAATPTTSNSPSSADPRTSQDLPPEVRAQAVFKCVKVTGVGGAGEDEYAYQTVVKIGGRIFKGVLQDHGVDTGSSDSASFGELQLGATSSSINPSTAAATTTTPIQVTTTISSLLNPAAGSFGPSQAAAGGPPNL